MADLSPHIRCSSWSLSTLWFIMCHGIGLTWVSSAMQKSTWAVRDAHWETWWVASRRQLLFGQMNCSRHWLREQSGYGNYSFSTHTHLDTVSEQSVHTLFPAKWPVSHVRKKCSLVVDSIEDRTIRIWSFSHKLTLNLLLINSRTVNTASKEASEQGARKGMLKIHTDTWGTQMRGQQRRKI